MTVRRILVGAVAVAAGVGLATASPASAYDTGAYEYAAGHMIERTDIPKSLGAYKPGLSFGANPGLKSLWICNVPQADPNAPDVTVKVPGPKYSFSASYNGRGAQTPFLNVNVNQYANATKAEAAFRLIQSRVKACSGTGSDTYTDDDGTTTTYSSAVSHGVVPSVTTAGVQSIFVSMNNLSETLPKGGISISDSYNVLSLFDDTIIETQYYSGGTKNLTTAQRRAVNKVAFNAETRWVG